MTNQVLQFVESKRSYFLQNDFAALSYTALHYKENHLMIILHSVRLAHPWVALALSVCLGFFGVDRMYIGQIGLGIAKLILLFFWIGIIWWLVDIFLIYHETCRQNALRMHIAFAQFPPR